MKNIVTIEWLKDNMAKEELIIFDARNALGDDSVGKAAYKNGHIPNAIHIPVEEMLTGEVKEHGGRHPLPNMNDFGQNMNQLGVDDESKVIIYDDGGLSMAGRLWWMLRYIGLKELYIAVGGYKAWEAQGYPISTYQPKIRKSKNLSINLQEDMIADIEDVKKAILDEDQVLVDSRSSDRYRGEVEPIDRVPGHIPSAINIQWTDLFSYEELDESIIKKRYETLADYDKIIVHCGSGITATVNVLFMEEAGLKPALYVGSYSDWISYPENEIVTEN